MLKSQQRDFTRKTKKPSDFAQGLRSFVGYLEGTSKAAHTILNYRLDVEAFHRYLEANSGGGTVQLKSLTRADVERYHDFLKGEGFKTNTRRRKILTVTRFLNYLSKRKKVSQESAGKTAAPAKIERIPSTVPYLELVAMIRTLPFETYIDRRNRLLLWTLAETGALVSEISLIHRGSWHISTDSESGGPRPFMTIEGKRARTLQISHPLYDAVQEYLSLPENQSKWTFPGHNRFGALGGAISSRGIELLVKHYSLRFAEQGFPELTPRTFRHSVLLYWCKEGVTRDEIQKRLGLLSAYAFRTFEPLLQPSALK